jgi:diguanylate cyclase
VGTRAFWAYVAVAAAAVGGFVLTTDDTWGQTAYQVAVGWLGAAAIVLGVRRSRPPAAAAWYLFAAGLFLNSSGQLAEKIASQVMENPFPSAADAFYLGLYPALAAGMTLLIRRRTERRDWAAMVDAATISTGLGLLSWVFLIRPAAGDPSLGLFGHAVNVAYPIGDILLLAMIVRLLVGGGGRSVSYRLIAASLACFLGGDVTWAVINQLGWEPGRMAGHLLTMTFLVAYVLFGAAALHPSIRQVGERESVPDARLSPALLLALTCASLIAPGLLAVEVLRHTVTDGVAIVVGSVALFLLVVTRMAQLLRQVEAQSRRLRELVRVDDLTGVPNRRALAAELPAAIEHARRVGGPLTVAVLDLDHFKWFNDDYGHQAGDRLLRGAAAAWTGQLRLVDRLARYGGEEFVVIFPETPAEEAAAILDRLREVTPAGQTFSAGTATWDGFETSEELIARADRALYRAKAAGRDRTVAAPHRSAGVPAGTVPLASR